MTGRATPYRVIPEFRYCTRCGLVKARFDLKCKRCGHRIWHVGPPPKEDKGE